MAICATPGCVEHYGCKLRNKGIQVSPAATMTRVRNYVPTPDKPPALYAEKTYDVRPDGSKMPILNPDGSHVLHRQAQREHRRIDTHLRHAHAST